MSIPDPDDEVVANAEKIARMAMGGINIEEFQSILFQTGATLAIWRAQMKEAGFSDQLIESAAWMILTGFYGSHLHNTEIHFEPGEQVQQGRPSEGQGGPGDVQDLA